MIIVGELINASRKSVAEAIAAQDHDTLANLAKAQVEAGADYIDVNAGVFVDQEIEYLPWLVQVVQKAVQVPCSLDSPNPEAIQAALKVHQGIPLINSISLEKARFDALLPVIASTDIKVVALCASDEGLPSTKDQRLAVAGELVDRLQTAGIPVENIHVDPLVQSIATDTGHGLEFLNAVEEIMGRWPGIHTMCGLSNVSYGLPQRKLLNRHFMTLAIGRGLDGAIINPLDRDMKAAIIAAEALTGRDDYCLQYIREYRAGRLA